MAPRHAAARGLSRVSPVVRLAWLVAGAVLAAGGVLEVPRLGACEICGQPTLTLADRIASSDIVALGKWIAVEPEKKNRPAATQLELVEVLDADEAPVKVKERLRIPGFHDGSAGALRLLTGRIRDDETIQWDEPLEMTEAGWRYATGAPDPDRPWAERLAYYLQFLENADVISANDAHAEVVNAPTADIALAARQLGPEKVRRWLQSPTTPATRKSAYWVLLGFAGSDDDARELERLVAAEATTLRLGLPGLIFGYLQLRGDAGLRVVNERYLKSATETDELGETGDAIKAVTWCWNNGNGAVSREALRQALRPLYTHPRHGEIVLPTLARWKDWELLEELAGRYGTPGFSHATMKRCIVGFLVSAAHDLPADPAADLPPHVAAARNQLETLRKRDPQLVAALERELRQSDLEPESSSP